MKFFTAIKQSEFAAALFTAAGLNFETMFAAGNVNALKDHLASLKPTEEASALSVKVKTLTDENNTLNAALASAKTENDEAKAELLKAVNAGAVLTGALAASGVKLPAATADKPVAQADVQGAIDARVSTKAAELLATKGHTVPIANEPSSDPAKVSKPGVMDKASFDALSPREKMEFSRKGGRLTE